LSYRVLIVDDYELWRRHIRSALQNHPRWQIVGEAGDGLEAIEKAATLRPDLILLDVSLPTVDGIESAPRILSAHPQVRILFLSEHRSPDIIEAAFATKACGYLLKSEAGRELLSAMQTIMDGNQFISAKLAHEGAHRANQPCPQRSGTHEAAFYSDEALLVDDYTRFAAAALQAGNALILVVNGARREQIHHRLRRDGIDVESAINDGRYYLFDPAELISSFMVDGRFDEAQCAEAIRVLVTNALQTVGDGHRVAACGDGAATLWGQGLIDASIRAEQLWDEITRTHPVDVLCGYVTPTGEPTDEDLQRLESTHTHVRRR
jgi:DNA-binding NarL/FixJ family response regulator